LTTSFMESATYRFPNESIAKPWGAARFTAGAKVVMMPGCMETSGARPIPCKRVVASRAPPEEFVTRTASCLSPGECGRKLTETVQTVRAVQLKVDVKSEPYLREK
jgi:hypothetical protein